MPKSKSKIMYYALGILAKDFGKVIRADHLCCQYIKMENSHSIKSVLLILPMVVREILYLISMQMFRITLIGLKSKLITDTDHTRI